MKANRSAREDTHGISQVLGVLLMIPIILMIISTMLLQMGSNIEELTETQSNLNVMIDDLDNVTLEIKFDEKPDKGNTIWYDDFEKQELQWNTYSIENNGSLSISNFNPYHCDHYYTKGHALEIKPNPDLGQITKAGISKPFSGQKYGIVSIEIAFTVSENEQYKIFEITQDKNINNASIRLNFLTNEFEYFDGAQYTNILDKEINLYKHEHCWHQMQLIVDYQISEYVAFIIDGQIIDLSGILLDNSQPGRKPVYTNISYYVIDNNINAVITYVDNFIFKNVSNFIISEINMNPVAVDDKATTTVDAPVTIDIMSNDNDPNAGDIIHLQTFDSASTSGGAITLIDMGTPGDTSDDQLDYLPPALFIGTDTFTYTIDDGNSGTDTATVTVTVGITPTAFDDFAATTKNNIVDIDVLSNDVPGDADIDSSTVDIKLPGVSNGVTFVNPVTGVVTYTPDVDYTGSDSFTYTVKDDDGDESNIATVSIDVANGVGPAANNDFVTTGLETAINIDILSNDIAGDTAIDPTTVDIKLPGVSNGVTSVNPVTGVVTYTPDPGYLGTDSFTYTVDDVNGNTSNVATVSITVSCFCGMTITADTTLNQDITACTGTIINIGADDVTLDGNGHYLQTIGDRGISCISKNNIVIKNCEIDLNGPDGDYGIYFSAADWGVIKNNKVSVSDDYGMYLAGCDNTDVYDNNVTTAMRFGSFGIYLYNNDNNDLYNNSIVGWGSSFYITSCSKINLFNNNMRTCFDSDSAGTGIIIKYSSDMYVDNNIIISNKNAFLSLYWYKVTDSQLSNNSLPTMIRLKGGCNNNLLCDNYFEGGDFITLKEGCDNNIIRNNTGIRTSNVCSALRFQWGCDNNLAYNNNFTTCQLIVIDDSANNIIHSNIITMTEVSSSAPWIIVISETHDGYGPAVNNLFYNNFINCANDDVVYIWSTKPDNDWNIAKTAGTNIVGGSFLGGNYWTNPTGTGYSDTCIDADGDGICDSPLDLEDDNSCTPGVDCSQNTDYLPLK